MDIISEQWHVLACYSFVYGWISSDIEKRLLIDEIYFHVIENHPNKLVLTLSEAVASCLLREKSFGILRIQGTHSCLSRREVGWRM